MKRGFTAFLVLLSLTALLFISGCTESENSGGDLTGQNVSQTSSVQSSVSLLPDSEYVNEFESEDGSFSMKWSINEDIVYFKMTGDSKGWVAVGFNPTSVMKDADIYLGYMDGDLGSIHDMYSTGRFGPHPDDTKQGGEFSVLNYTVSESGGKTTVEFSRYLDTKDTYDSVIEEGETVDFIWAIADRDDPDFKHSVAKGSGTIVL
ncbi:hypothetical protein J2128_001348 [Methanomicrobium sp. W14]|uniref:DOMON domain-containing protein n=1 Tax=Methanomicrobium sp. W14 TaxID=2817839 RepID=UPI001AE4E637|nr:DOMON domain-containing protein [Methanomicrobium sp. W14]MBP2133394.1 hypothetical protein [Methanomicrobium sp. W14]